MDARNRLNLAFSTLSAAETVALTRRVYTAMKSNDAIPKPDGTLAPTLESLMDAGNALEESIDVTQAGNRTASQLQLREERHADCKKKLTKIGHFAQLTLSEEPQLLAGCGFDMMKSRGGGIIKSGLLAVTNFTVENLPHPGALVASMSPIKGALVGEIQITDKDPLVEANFQHYDVFPNLRDMVITGQAPCTRVSVRARIITRNEKSPWSSPVTIVVT